jgi:hypothetical protein
VATSELGSAREKTELPLDQSNAWPFQSFNSLEGQVDSRDLLSDAELTAADLG